MQKTNIEWKGFTQEKKWYNVFWFAKSQFKLWIIIWCWKCSPSLYSDEDDTHCCLHSFQLYFNHFFSWVVPWCWIQFKYFYSIRQLEVDSVVINLALMSPLNNAKLKTSRDLKFYEWVRYLIRWPFSCSRSIRTV